MTQRQFCIFVSQTHISLYFFFKLLCANTEIVNITLKAYFSSLKRQKCILTSTWRAKTWHKRIFPDLFHLFHHYEPKVTKLLFSDIGLCSYIVYNLKCNVSPMTPKLNTFRLTYLKNISKDLCTCLFFDTCTLFHICAKLQTSIIPCLIHVEQ